MAFFRGDVYSYALDKMTPLAVYLPWDDQQRFQVQEAPKTLVLLHGVEGNGSYWSRYSSAERYAQVHNLALIMPEAEMSMYADMRYGRDYARYIGVELKQIIDALFRLETKRENFFIAGLSMGGYGALRMALTYPEQFSRCASFSGALMLGSQDYLAQLSAWQDRGRNQPYDADYELERTLYYGCRSAYGEDFAYNPANDLLYLAQQALASGRQLPDILLTCGAEDMLYDVNRRYCQAFDHLGLAYQFQQWPGVHDWKFWDESLRDYIGFFS